MKMPARHNWYWDEIDDEEADEAPRMRDLRLSVRSLLREYEEDWESVPDLELGTMDTLQERASRCWGLDVMSDIFKKFGMEYENKLWNEINTPRGSLIGERKSTIRLVAPEEREMHQLQVEPAENESPSISSPVIPATPEEPPQHSLSELLQQEEEYVDSHNPVDFESDEEKRLFYHQDPLPEKVHNSDDRDQPKKYYNYPLSPPESIEDTNNSHPRSPQSPLRFTSPTRLPTPPTSPESMFTKPLPRPSKDTVAEQDHPLDLRCPHCGPIAAGDIRSSTRKGKEHTSFFGAFKKRFRRQTSSPKLREVISRQPPLPVNSPKIIPKYVPPTPRIIPTPQIIPQRIETSFTASSRDDLLKGPTLKINRLSDISLPLSPEEKKEIDRKRATGSTTTSPDEFDLVLRLGTFRHPRENAISTARPDNLSIHTGGEDIRGTGYVPPVPMIDPDHLKSPSVVSFAIPSPTASQFRETRAPVPKKIKRRTSRKFRRTKLNKDDPILRSMLSEDNLAKLNKITGPPSPPSMPSPISIVVPPPTLPLKLNHRLPTTSAYAPTDTTLSPTFSIPVPPIPPAARKRLLPDTADQFPLAQTTALGLKGGRVGVVQMGSASKANKILGDMVLIVPEPVTMGRRRRGVRAPSLKSARSVKKVEKLRGERLAVEMANKADASGAAGGAEVVRPKSKGAVWIV